MIYPLLLLITDFVTLLAAFTVAYILRVQIDSRPLVQEIEAITFIKVFLLLIPFWLIVNALLGLYSRHIFEKRLPELGRLLVGSFIGILIVIGFDFTQDDSIFPARAVPIYAFIAAFILLALARNLLWIVRRKLFKFGIGVRNVLIIGSNTATTQLAEILMETRNSGYRIVGIIGNKNFLPRRWTGKHFSHIGDALDNLSKLGIHTIIQTELYESEKLNQRIFESIRNNHLQYKFIPSQSDFYTGKNTVEVLWGFPVISVHQTPLIGWGRIFKRMTDIFLAFLALLLVSPFIILVVIFQKIREPRAPIFYAQERVTRYGTKFKIFKFRTMIWKYSTGKNAPCKDDIDSLKKMGREDLIAEFLKTNKLANDPRVTKFGSFLRKTSIDELPQLINVLRGDLSLVGPRAVREFELKAFRDQAGGDVVLSVKSGVTGLWQVSGRSNLSLEERVRLELYYVQNWSLWLDIKILLKTVLVVLKGSGAR